ncbi:MAG: ABC transporter ATP-binding protein [Acidobacteriota bacterium]
MAAAALEFRNVSKVYRRTDGGQRYALRDVSLQVPSGRSLAITGRSGSGKSTLLNLAAGIDRPSRGTILAAGQSLDALTERQQTLRRRDEVGLVFQFFHLLSHLTVAENVALPQIIAGKKRAVFEARSMELLERVGLADHATDPVESLSGGEMQRVALCRALVHRPRLLLADEPTGNLDDQTGRMVMDLLLRLTREAGCTLVYVTHDLSLARLSDLSMRLHSGILDSR